jgi:hypothetical protein
MTILPELPVTIVGGNPLNPTSAIPIPLVITYKDPDGNIWNFSDISMSKGYVCSAIAGIEGLAVMMQVVPLLDGTSIPNIYIPQPGTIGFAVLLCRPPGGSQTDYYNLLDAFTRAFTHRRNEVPAAGTLIIRRPDGTTRQASVYTSSGLNTPEVGINNTTLYSLSLSTPDPYWYDSVAQQTNWRLGYATGILPVLPVALQGPDILGDKTVFNQGNSLTYPIWTITGPGTPIMTNKTAGRTWTLNTPIPAGQVVQVNTARGQQGAVNLTTKANIWNQLVFTGPHDLWPIMGGNNVINVELAGATAASNVNLQYTQRWSRA